MSNGLHHVAPASFFPTAKELSSGLQWFKEHPILAAAAATAVSVITYLHTADDDVDAAAGADAAALGELLAADAEAATAAAATSSACAATRPSAATPPLAPRRRASSPSMLPTPDAAARAACSPPLLTRRASTPVPGGRATPPALRKPGSEGKMSPAAVTWVDEHGGSLTQVFEHLIVDSDDNEDGRGRPIPDLDGPPRGPGGAVMRPQGRPPTPRRNTKPIDELESELADEEEAPPSGHWMGPFGIASPQLASGVATPPVGAADRSAESPSPQWGWYVPITPPQDHLTGGVASSSSASATRSAAAAAVATIVRAQDAAPSSSAMRRSASGRIKATS